MLDTAFCHLSISDIASPVNRSLTCSRDETSALRVTSAETNVHSLLSTPGLGLCRACAFATSRRHHRRPEQSPKHGIVTQLPDTLLGCLASAARSGWTLSRVHMHEPLVYRCITTTDALSAAP